MPESLTLHSYLDLFQSIDEDKRRAIVHVVCSRREELDPSRSSALGIWLERAVYKGFRGFDEAPPSRWYAGLSRSWRRHPEFWGLILRSWLDLREDLAEAVEAVRLEHGIGTTCECDPTGVSIAWQEELLLRLSTEVAKRVAGVSNEEARLALLVTSTGVPGSACDTTHDDAEPDDAEVGPKVAFLKGDESTPEELPKLTTRLETLAQTFAATAVEVHAEAERLRAGHRPDAALAKRILALESQFDALRTDVAALTKAPGIESRERIGELRDALDTHERAVREEGTQTILRLALRLRSTKALPELDQLHSKIRGMLSADGSADPMVVAAVGALLTLTGDEVDLEQAEDLGNLVSERLGHKLMLAANRRWLELAPEDVQHRPEAERTQPGIGTLDVGIPAVVRQEIPPPLACPPDAANAASGTEGHGAAGSVGTNASEAPRSVVDAEPMPRKLEQQPIPFDAKRIAEDEAGTFARERPSRSSSAGDVRPVEELARETIELPPEIRSDRLARVVWALVGSGELGLAHALALGAAASGEPPTWSIPAPLLRGLASAPYVRSSDDAATLHILQAITELEVVPAMDACTRARTVLMAAMALRPALLSPASRALGFLQSLELDATGNMLEIREQIAASQALRVEVGPGLLAGLGAHSEWQAQLSCLQRECATWLERARQSTLVFAGATDVWHRLLMAGSVLLDLVGPVIANETGRRNAVKQRLDDLAANKELERLIRVVERDVRGRKAVTNPVSARAFQSLLQHSRDALSFPQRWVELVDLAPQRREGVHLKAITQWRNRLVGSVEKGKHWLKHAPQAADATTTAARRVLLHAIEDLAALFDADHEAPPPLPLEVVLGRSLLRVPEVYVGHDWSPSGTPMETGTRVLRALAAGLPSWKDALETYFHEQRFLSVQRVIELAEDRLIDGVDGASATPRLEQELASVRAALRRELDARRGEVEAAVALDLLREDERLEIMAVLEGVVPETTLDFGPARDELARIAATLAAKHQERAAEVRARLEQDGTEKRDPDAHRRILDALGRGDIPTATEYLDAAARNEPLVASPLHDQFGEYFPRFVRDSAEMNLADVGRSLQAGQSHGPVRLVDVPHAQREQAAEMVRAWTRAKNRADLPANVGKIFEGIGFRSVTVRFEVSRPDAPNRMTGERGDPQLQLGDMTCDPIRDRDVCVIPQFGSQARGRYRVLLAWSRATEEEVLNFLGTQGPSNPAIVMYFGRMNEARRRDLAHMSRKRKRQVLFVDDTLLAFLAMQRGARLPVLFQCALPFTVAEPYPTAAGHVPVEMFFGRRRERQAIMDPLGTSLVYGGRQLGKTALLREVERSQHAPDRGVIVSWIDLKQAQIGFARPASDLWEVIGGLLEKEKVLNRRTTDVKTIQGRVKEWLNGDPSRRIVLLLDEADQFLTADREDPKSYPVLLQLKQLLDETEKRFKFVLAGLHDVQRTSRDPNSPLAHLGAPICIGPLLGGGEALEARALIELPLQTLGYRFDSPDLPTRILSHTNYYPSLIQLFCGYLLDHVSNTRVVTFDPKGSPPFIITAKHVEDAYQTQALRDAIRDRFTWTLDLDLRYKLIALLIALESLEDRHALVIGFAADAVRKLAMSWWPTGFSDSTLEAFRTILDEMVGLGLLRKPAPGTYALRSANVLNLLGSKAEIEAQIEDLSAREPPKPHEHANLRRQLTPDEPWRRSPLTFTQEARLLDRSNGACIVFGMRIAERDDLPRFLQAAAPDAVVSPFDGPTQQEFEIHLQEMIDSRPRLGIVVVTGSPWTERWVESAHRLLVKRKARDSFVQAIFVGDPGAALRWVRLDSPTRNRLEDALGIETFSLCPWNDGALRAWFEEARFGPANSSEGRQRIRDVTGGWGALVHRFGDACQRRPQRWEEHLQEIARTIDPNEIVAYAEIPPPIAASIKALTQWQGAGAVEDVAAAEGIAPEQLHEALDCAVLLNAASLTAGAWAMDPLLARAIREAS